MVEDLLDDLGRQPHRGFVEQDHLGPRHQCTADGAHLLLAAGGVAGERLAAIPQPREIGVDEIDVLPDGGLAVAARERAGQEVLLDRQMGEAMAAFHHLHAAAPHQLVRRARLHLLAVEHDRALGDLAALGMQQVRDRLQGRRLAGAVRTEQRHDPALRHLQRHALQHEDDVVVDDLDVVDDEDRLGGRGLFDGGHCGLRFTSPRLRGEVA